MSEKFVSINPEEADLRTIYSLLIGGVAPRPIAFVSTISADGINNLAPFSFFNAFGSTPPYIGFSVAYGGRDGSAKDTLNNVREIPECVVQMVNHGMVEQASLASTAFNKDVDEFQKSGLTPIDSDRVRPRRAKESPFQMECKVEQIIDLGGDRGSGNLVLCRVVKFHMKDGLYENGMIHPNAIDLVGRNSGNFYTRASGEAVFEVAKPRRISIGIDQLPEFIKKSEILSANNLAQLGGIEALPSEEEISAFSLNYDTDTFKNGQALEDYERNYLDARMIWHKNPSGALTQVENAVLAALKVKNVDFAIKALLSMNSL